MRRLREIFESEKADFVCCVGGGSSEPPPQSSLGTGLQYQLQVSIWLVYQLGLPFNKDGGDTAPPAPPAPPLLTPVT